MIDNYMARRVRQIKATCSYCSGKGQVRDLKTIRGRTEVIKTICPNCNGAKVIEVDR